MEQTKPKNNSSALYTLITVFFFWGFVAASNDILIPVFKDKLHLEQWQSQMVSFAFWFVLFHCLIRLYSNSSIKPLT